MITTFPIQREICTACGHQHGGEEVAFICIGCPCPEEPGRVGSTSKTTTGQVTFCETCEMNKALAIAEGKLGWVLCDSCMTKEAERDDALRNRAFALNGHDGRIDHSYKSYPVDVEPADVIHMAELHMSTALPCCCASGFKCTKHLALAELATRRPKVVVLCGSTRFHSQFVRANYDETMAGHIVLSVGFAREFAESVEAVRRKLNGEDVGCTAEQKLALDELHKRKIDLADEVIVLNVGGYVGKSTQSEIEYAELCGKPIRWLEEPR